MSTPNSANKEKIHQLYKLMRELRALGIGRVIDLPEIVVCGSQSSGKSTLLSRLTEFTFPSDEDVCTRFPIRLTLRCNPALKGDEARYSVSIQAHRSTPQSRADRYQDFNRRNASGRLNDPAAVAHWIREVTNIMGLELFDENRAVRQDEDNVQLDGTSPRFSYDVFCLEIEGPFSQDMTVIDLPGIFEASEAGRQSKPDILYVRKMVKEYVSRENTVVLAVMDAGRDMLTQQVISFLAEIEQEMCKHLEVMAVVTKPDREDTEHGRRTLVKRINEGTVNLNGHRMTHGWHVVRNFQPSAETTDPTAIRKELAEKEQDFFKSQGWQGLKVEFTGIKRLLKRVHGAQFTLNLKSLPSVTHQIDDRLQEINIEIGQLRNSSSDNATYPSNVDDVLYDMSEFLHTPRMRRDLSGRFDDKRLNLRRSFDQASAEYRKALSDTVGQCFKNIENITFDNLTEDAHARLESHFQESLELGLRWQVHPRYVDEAFRIETRNWTSLSSAYVKQLTDLFGQHIEALLTLHPVFRGIFPAFQKHFLTAALTRLKNDLTNETAFGTDPNDLDECEKPTSTLLTGFPDAIAAYCEKNLSIAWGEAQAENSLDLAAIRSRMSRAARTDAATETILINTGIRSFCAYYKDQLEKLRAADGEASIRAKIDERFRSVITKEEVRTIRRDESMKKEFALSFSIEDSIQYQDLVASKEKLEQAKQSIRAHIPADVSGANKRIFVAANDVDDVEMLDIGSKRPRTE